LVSEKDYIFIYPDSFHKRTNQTGFFPFNAVVPALNSLGEASRPKAGQTTPETLFASGAITAASYRRIVEAICLLRGEQPPSFQSQPPLSPVISPASSSSVASSSEQRDPPSSSLETAASVLVPASLSSSSMHAADTRENTA
jgi:hypothetical protein